MHSRAARKFDSMLPPYHRTSAPHESELSLTDMLIEIRVFLLSGNRSGRANGPLMCARKKTTTYPMFHVLEKGLKMLRLDHIGL